MAFDDIIRPDGLSEILIPRNPNNQSGFRETLIPGDAPDKPTTGEQRPNSYHGFFPPTNGH